MASSSNASNSTSVEEFQTGDSVVLQSLEKAPELNGRVGFVAVDPESRAKGRVPVQLCDEMPMGQPRNPRILSLKPTNLYKIQATGFQDIKECQVRHWKEEHKNDCALTKASRKAASRKRNSDNNTDDDNDPDLPTDRGDRVYYRMTQGARLMQTGRPDLAEREFRKAIEQDGFLDAGAYLNLVGAITMQQMPTAATMTSTVNATSITGATAGASSRGGGLPRDPECVHLLRLALRVPDEARALPEVHRTLADTYYRMGDYEAAIASYQEALRYAPGSTELTSMLETCRTKLRQQQEQQASSTTTNGTS